MNESEPVDAAVEPCSCKLGRNLTAYGLEDLHATVRQRRADGDSLRDLERFVNRSLLDAAIRAAGADVIGDVDAIYDALTGDDVSAGSERKSASAWNTPASTSVRWRRRSSLPDRQEPPQGLPGRRDGPGEPSLRRRRPGTIEVGPLA